MVQNDGSKAVEDSKHNLVEKSDSKPGMNGDFRIEYGVNEKGKKIRKYIRSKVS